MVTNLELWTSLFGQNKLKLRGEADAPIQRLLWDESLRDRFGIDALVHPKSAEPPVVDQLETRCFPPREAYL